MTIQKNISLKNYNTFGIDVLAKRFISVRSYSELKQLLKTEKKFFLISGGSNILLTSDIESLVVHIDMKGIFLDQETANEVYLTVNAGENWHAFVLWCIDHGYGSLENLSFIPGNVGTCPIQNIGAYGVEVKDVITKVTGIEITNSKKIEFSNSDCVFTYRDSIFKNRARGKYIITSVSFKLTKNHHVLNTSYGSITSFLEDKSIFNPTIRDVSNAVIAIRQSKLPDPNKIGNGGSFFKNPVISKEHFDTLRQQYPTIPGYMVSESTVKVPAGWLIEKAGFKGYRSGDAGVYEKQALVVVNYGNANGKEILGLAKKIQVDVLERFDINLDMEVNVI
ncbi:MAG: UDP-N-acetylmuramate dehydrogenase [Flavobacteriaceae bacterium]|nr:MAG: UDP-N-acetylmuramate dehydrogenase [Flavobacteriaceae bacterium]